MTDPNDTPVRSQPSTPGNPDPAAGPGPTSLTDEWMKNMLEAGLPATPLRSNSRVWQPPTAEELQRLLPQYQILSVLGRGGMAAVYKGVQTSLHRPVAIKILPPEAVADDQGSDFLERFKLEARAMAKLNHPGIVSVYDFGETSVGQLYIVMEFVDGTDVAKMIHAQGRLPPDHALAIIAHVCDALHYAHSHGVIHRDIKPANVLVNTEGQVKIADFGLAKATDTGVSALTKTNMAMGTPDFMAPEAMVNGLLVDQRADVYAVGVMLYNMLTGNVPRGLFQMPSKMIGSDPRYDAIIDHAMQADREHRYPDTMGMRRDVDEILTMPAAARTGDGRNTRLASAVEQQMEGETQASLNPESEIRYGASGSLVPDAKRPRSMSWLGVGLMTVGVAGGLVLWSPWKTTHIASSSSSSSSASAAPAAREAWTVDPVSNHDHSPAPATTPVPVPANMPFTNSLGMKFAPVPGTAVLFCIHDTRKEDYRQYATATPGVDDSWKKVLANGVLPASDGEDHPVVEVSWEDAKGFCAWLSGKEGRTYRLPTDDEWSWAVGIGDREDETASPASKNAKVANIQPWGKQWPPLDGAGNYADLSLKEKLPSWSRGIVEGYRDKYATTSPVMSFKPNQWGLYDMGGNVWQWCEDWEDATQKTRVLRGGSWGTSVRDILLSSHRDSHTPTYRSDDVGFRVVVVP